MEEERIPDDELGELLCPACEGDSWVGSCKKCGGMGKIDWIENLIKPGKRAKI